MREVFPNFIDTRSNFTKTFRLSNKTMYFGTEAGATTGIGVDVGVTVTEVTEVAEGIRNRIIYVVKPSIFSIFLYLRKNSHHHLHRQHKAASPLIQKLAAKNITFVVTIILGIIPISHSPKHCIRLHQADLLQHQHILHPLLVQKSNPRHTAYC